jgi:Na+/proline symporter
MTMTLPVVALLLVSLLIGLHGATRIGGKVRNFYVAGNIIPSWIIALSLVGQAIDSGSSLGNATRTMTDGFWSGAVLPIGIGFSLLVIGFFFAERMHRMKILTLADFYGKHYGPRVETLASILCVASFVTLLASNLAGVAIVLHYLLPLPVNLLVVIVGVAIMAYVIAGGLFAAAWNDILHVGVMITGFGAALLWLVNSSAPGSMTAAFEQGFSWAPLHERSAGALPTWATLIALGFGDVVALDFMERVFAAKTPRHARNAALVSGVCTIALGILIGVLGIIARAGLAAKGAQPGPNGFLDYVRTQLPQGISMVVFMALIAACLSTADGVLMACSSVLTRNVVQRNFPAFVPKDRLLRFSRLCLIPLTIFACVFAIVRPDPGDLLVLAFEVVLAGCFVPLALGVYWGRGTPRAAFWAILVPSMLRVVLYFIMPPSLGGIDTLLPPIVSLVLFVSISLAEARVRADAGPSEAVA